MVARISFLLGLLASGACGGASTTAQAPSTDCEPGRCLEDISKAIQPYRQDARGCYDHGREQNPQLEGKLVINFEIDPDGSVVETSQGMQDHQLEDPDVIACVSEIIKKIKFPKSPAGRRTRGYHSFEFSPRS